MIVACDSNKGIGFEKQIPWNVPEDMLFFKKTTIGGLNNAVIMGRKTWESIPRKIKPLQKRLNVVLSRSEDFDEKVEGVLRYTTIDECIKGLQRHTYLEEVFIIGGSEIYHQFIDNPLVTKIYVTEIHSEHVIISDVFFPSLDTFSHTYSSDMKTSSSGMMYMFNTYSRENEEEHEYIKLCNTILSKGNHREDRTGTGTLCVFGCTMRFSLKNGIIPLMTTKRVFWRGIVEELLFFISGSSNTKLLSDKGVRIWEGNTSREFLDARGLVDYEVSEYGPMYGFQWRHWGAEYKGLSHDYSGEGIDQLQKCIDMIKNDPDSRRIVMSAWNPDDLDKGVLPPCHYSVQFYCCADELSMVVIMRSVDIGLGFPFNVASYSLLLYMVSQITNKIPGEIVFQTGDTHIYKNHISGIKEQILRKPCGFPKLLLNKDIKNIDDFSMKDINLIDYHPHPTIKLDMAI